jgi:hypothetical protein
MPTKCQQETWDWTSDVSGLTASPSHQRLTGHTGGVYQLAVGRFRWRGRHRLRRANATVRVWDKNGARFGNGHRADRGARLFVGDRFAKGSAMRDSNHHPVSNDVQRPQTVPDPKRPPSPEPSPTETYRGPQPHPNHHDQHLTATLEPQRRSAAEG